MFRYYDVPNELLTMSYAIEAYFAIMLNNMETKENIPNVGKTFRDTLYSLCEEFDTNDMSFTNSALGLAIQIHLTVVMMQAMTAFSMYSSTLMQARMASSRERHEKLMKVAQEYLDKYQELCEYISNYSIYQNMDKTVEDAVEQYKEQGDDDEEIERKKEDIEEDVNKVQDNKKKKEDELQNQDENEKEEEKQELDDQRQEVQEEKNEEEKEQMEIDNNSNGINPEDTKDELIPGTNINKPRDRGVYETDEEYNQFLNGYYDKAFGSDTVKNSQVPETTALVPADEHKQELSMMMSDLDSMPKTTGMSNGINSVATTGTNSELSQMMKPVGTTGAIKAGNPNVMTK